MAWSLRSRLRLSGLAYKLLSRSSCAGAGKLSAARVLSNRNTLLPAEAPLHAPLAPHHVMFWNLWQADRLSIKQIGERLNIKEETVVNLLTFCITNGCPIDWVDVCREANLNPNVARLLEEAYVNSHKLPNVSSFLSSHNVTAEQCGVYRLMKACGIDHQGIVVISSASKLQEVEVHRSKGRLWSTGESCRNVKPGQAGQDEVETGVGDVKQHFTQCKLVSMQKELWEYGPLQEAVEALQLLVERQSRVASSLLFQVLRRCVAHNNLVLGRRVYALALQCGRELNSSLGNQIIRMYASHGRLEEATKVLTSVAAPDCRMWASIISAHGEQGQPMQAINLYRQMRRSGLKANSYVFVATLKACSAALDLASGKEVHANILESTFEPDVFVGSCLVDMYSKCGSLGDARRVFDRLPVRDVVTWTAMIAGYAQHGLGQEALALYDTMQQDGMSTCANNVTFVCLLQACGSLKALCQGQQLHAQIQQRGLESDAVIGNCLVDMYSKCGELDVARALFDELPRRDVVTWTSMIAGYSQHGLAQDALDLYAAMQQCGVSPGNSVTFVCLLQACASVGALHQGKELHIQIQERGLEGDVMVGNSLVDMYGKCGDLVAARRTFDKLGARDVVTWTALLNGYAQHNQGKMAVQAFEEMKLQGVEPDSAAFICLLVACSHEGLVNEGRQYFRSMVEEHGIQPALAHHNCMVDLLGRSGHLDEAESMLQSMASCGNDAVGWTSLLGACKVYRDVDRGLRCFDRIVGIEPQHSAPYVLLESLYANAGRWRDVERVERLRKWAGAWKKPAKACIEVRKEVHEFVVGGDRADISSKLRSVKERLRGGDHVPHTDLVLQGAVMTQAEKEDALCGHAEKLALAYGLLNTPDGTTLLVTKNLRMCDDCHSGTKVMSRLEKREIIVRDAHRVHHFVDGSCSCGDRH